MQKLKQIKINLISYAINDIKIRHLRNKMSYLEISPQTKIQLKTLNWLKVKLLRYHIMKQNINNENSSVGKHC